VSDLYPFAPHVLDLDGLRYHYVDEGRGDPVLMVHGNPTWSFYWRELVKSLRGRYRTIAPDHIGCGRSDKPSDDRYAYTLASRVADLGRLVEELDLRNITLVVHDWGGAIGMAWAVQHPDRVARIVVLNTAAFHLPDGKGFPPAIALARVPLLGGLLVRGANAFVRGSIRFCVTRRALPPEVAAGYLEPHRNNADRIAVHRFVQDIPLRAGDPAYDLITRTAEGLPRLADKPMLIAWGMKDFVFDHHFLAEWERRFPRAAVHRFDDCGHWVLEDARDEILALVDTFLEQHPLEARA
jgi:pimeloyl-ACP methyl ester carboxylesterase